MIRRKSSIVGLICIITSIIVLLTSKISTQSESIKSKRKVINYINTTTSYIDKKEVPDSEYIAVLEIPVLNLKRGLTDNPKYNDIKYNVAMLSTTTPNTVNSNLVLAAHSGTNPVAYFNNLNKLQIDDEIYIYYNGYKYTYRLNKYYEIDKTGYANIIRDKEKTTLTLITCSDNDNKQLIYISYLVNISMY